MPSFIIIGAQRSGTTSLYRYLTACPHIAPADRKEVHFFDRHFEKGTNWYRAFFVSCLRRWAAERIHKRDLITGEASPYYIFNPLAPQRVAKVLAKVKIIALLRNPIDRAYSHYWHMIKLGHETLSFENAIERESERLWNEQERLLKDKLYYSAIHRRYSYLARGIYVDQLQAWECFFPRAQIMILCSEEFYADPAASLRQVCEFLDVPHWEHDKYRKYNQSHYPQMASDTRKHLSDYFKPHNERLYDYLGMCFDWE